MISFDEFVKENEEKEDELESSRKSLLLMIANALNKYRSSDKADTKSMLMLIAALGLLNAKDESNLTLSAARRLATTSKK